MLHGDSIGTYTALAFAAAAIGQLGNVVIHNVGATVGIPPTESVLDLTILITYGGVLVGLVGMYTVTTQRAPWLSRVGVLLVCLSGGSIVLALLGKYLLTDASPAVIRMALSVLFYASSTLSLLVFGLVCLRTQVPSRTVGYLFLAAGASRIAAVAGATGLAAVLFVVPMFTVSYLVRGMAVPAAVAVSRDEPAL